MSDGSDFGKGADGWRLLARSDATTNNPEARRLVQEAEAAVPSTFDWKSDGPLLPKRRAQGKCRICGQFSRLTREHIPPRASGNKSVTVAHNIDNWLSTKDLSLPSRGPIQQGGISGFTLCQDCNNFTGHQYGREYRKWVTQTNEVLRTLPSVAVLDALAQPLGLHIQLGSSNSQGVRPGAFVRQVLSFMCSLSGAWDLAGQHPEVRDMILDQTIEPMPVGLALGMCLYLGPRIRIAGPTLRIVPEEQLWEWLIELAYPPFAFLFVLASNQASPGRGLMMTDWTQIGCDSRQLFEGPTRVGFGWTPYPGDYRSSGEIAATVPLQ